MAGRKTLLRDPGAVDLVRRMVGDGRWTARYAAQRMRCSVRSIQRALYDPDAYPDATVPPLPRPKATPRKLCPVTGWLAHKIRHYYRQGRTGPGQRGRYTVREIAKMLGTSTYTVSVIGRTAFAPNKEANRAA